MSGYRVKLQRVAVAGGGDLQICSLLDRQQYADPFGEAEAAGISPACWPLFGQIWPSGRQLADLMQSWVFGGRSVLEMGCGLALASLVVHRRGGDVTASGRHRLAECFLRVNLSPNGMSGLEFRVGHWTRENPGLGKFGLIIGSDLLYERSHPEQVAAFIELHASREAEVLIIDPNRGNRLALQHHMRRLGFLVDESTLEAMLDDGHLFRGRLLRYRRFAQSVKRV